MKNLTTIMIASILLSFAGAAAAQTRGSIKLTATATQTRTVTGKNGVKTTTMVPVGRVLPGTKVTYTITYRNTGGKPAGNVVIHDPVPGHMHYIAGSAKGAHTTISYSVDGGKTWAAAPARLTVTSSNGSTRAATADDVTTLRWVVNGKVAPGASGTVSFVAALQ